MRRIWVGMTTAALMIAGCTGPAAQVQSRDGQIPLRVGVDPAAIPIDDTRVTQIIPLQYIPAEQLRIDLGPIISPEADVRAFATPNILIITDTTAHIHRLAEI